MKGSKKAIMKLSALIVFWGLAYFYFSKVCREINLLGGKNLPWTGWTLNFVFAVIVILGLAFSIWIISGKDEEVEKVQKTEEIEAELKEKTA